MRTTKFLLSSWPHICNKPCMFQAWKFIRGYCVINLNFNTNKLRMFYLLAYATFYYFVQGSVNTWLYIANKHLILIVTERIKLKTAWLRHIPFLEINTLSLQISSKHTIICTYLFQKGSKEIEILYTLHNPIRVQDIKPWINFPIGF